MPTGSVEPVCPSAGVCLEMALALIWAACRFNFVMPNSTFDHVWLGLGLWSEAVEQVWEFFSFV